MKSRNNSLTSKIVIFSALLLGNFSCSGKHKDHLPLSVPRGFVSTLEIDMDGRLLHFGPFVGYYFRPLHPDDLTALEFVCYNEQSFYTKDLPRNAKLFEGQAVLAFLPGENLPETRPRQRILPVFSDQIPVAWLRTRPHPEDEFRHFHSCYNARGYKRYGYWLRHVAVTDFVYDMGGRVESGSPLYHRVLPGVDTDFPQIVEFDSGPTREVL